MAILCTQDDVETIILQDFDNTPEPVITDLIGRASDLIESYCNRAFEAQSGIVETLDGRSATLFRLAQEPVTAINTVTESGVALVAADYLWYGNGVVVRGDGTNQHLRWPYQRQSVVVDYDAGYATIPRDLADVASRLVARWFQAGSAYAAAPDSAAAVKRISLSGSDEVEYADAVHDVAGVGNLNDAEMRALETYRRYVFA